MKNIVNIIIIAMKFWIIVVTAFVFATEPTSLRADNGKGIGAANYKGAKGKGVKGRGKGNSFARGKAKHRVATESIATTIANETGNPTLGYESYASDLANVLGQLDTEAIDRIFGDKRGMLPPAE